MAARNYSNIAVSTSLVSGIGSGDTSLTVADATGWPAAPFILVIDPGTANEELVLVGAKAGAVFSSLTRGFGGTSAVAHSGSDPVDHVISADDASFLWSHVHSGSGGDDSAQVAHSNLSGLTTDNHHNEDHAARHEVGGADELAIGPNQFATACIRGQRITSAQSLSGGRQTIIYNSVVQENDPDGEILLNTTTGVLTLGPGWWLVGGGINFGEDYDTDWRLVQIVVDSVENDPVAAQSHFPPGVPFTHNAYHSIETLIYIPSSTKTVKIQVELTSGVTEQALATQGTYIQAFKIRGT